MLKIKVESSIQPSNFPVRKVNNQKKYPSLKGYYNQTVYYFFRLYHFTGDKVIVKVRTSSSARNEQTIEIYSFRFASATAMMMWVWWAKQASSGASPVLCAPSSYPRRIGWLTSCPITWTRLGLSGGISLRQGGWK